MSRQGCKRHLCLFATIRWSSYGYNGGHTSAEFRRCVRGGSPTLPRMQAARQLAENRAAGQSAPASRCHAGRCRHCHVPRRNLSAHFRSPAAAAAVAAMALSHLRQRAAVGGVVVRQKLESGVVLPDCKSSAAARPPAPDPAPADPPQARRAWACFSHSALC